MSNRSFNTFFILDDFNKANSNIALAHDDKLFKLFNDFISSTELLTKAIENNQNEISPISLFLETYEEELLEYFSTSIDVKKSKASLIGLWDHLFLRLNQNDYKKKDSVQIKQNNFFQHLPIYRGKTLEVFIEGVTFVTRSMVCIKSYNKIVTEVAKYSDAIKSDESVFASLDKYFINNFFKDDETSIDKRVTRFNGTNIKECKNSGASLFLLKSNIKVGKKENNAFLSKERIFDMMKKSIKKYIEQLIEFDKINSKPFQKTINDYGDILKNIDSDCEDTIKMHVLKINNDYKEARFKLNNYFKNEYDTNDISKSFNELGKYITKINSDYDAFKVISNNKYRILLYINRLGTANIILLDYINLKSEWGNDSYNCEYDNKLVDAAFIASKKIEDSNHHLAKLFNYIDINKIVPPTLCRKYKAIIGQPYDKYMNQSDNIGKQIHENNNSLKATYIRLTYNHNNLILGDHSPMIYFDYLSYLIGFSHSYDKYSLWEFANNKKPFYDEYKDKSKDFSSSRTSHIFYDDSLFTYAIMDQSPRFIEFNNLIKKDPDFKNLQSHQHRLYSLWEFSSICDALIYGSSSTLVNSFLIRQVEKESKRISKLKTLSSQHRLAKVHALVNLKFNHLAYNSKGRNFALINNIFECIGLNDVEEKAKSTFKANWEYANLNNGRLYSRIGFYLSIASLSVSLIAFAWAGAIFYDGKFKDGTYESYKWSNLFEALFKTDKLYFVLIVAAIPIIILFSVMIYDYIKNYFISLNLMKFFIKKDLKYSKNNKSN